MQTASKIEIGSLERASTWTQTSQGAGAAQWQLLVLVLLVLDVASISAAFALAYMVRFEIGLPVLETPPYSLRFYSTLVFGAVPVWLMVFAGYQLYDRHYLLGGIQEYTKVANACTIGMVTVIVASFLEPTLAISRGWLLLSWVLAISLVGASRFVLRRVVYRLRGRGLFLDATILIGANEEARALAEHLRSTPAAGMFVIGAVDDSLPAGTLIADGTAILGSLGDLDGLVERHAAKELLVAPTALSREELLEVYRAFAHRRGLNLRMSSGLFEILTTGVSVKQVGAVPLISPENVRITGLDAIMKAALDCVGAVFGLAITCPLFALIAVLIKIGSPGPVFHRRRVLGREGRPFAALKFRTMVDNADEVLNNDPALRQHFEQDFKLKDDPRVTRVGRFLRRTSLDELPQLINVLLGQMSLVGPRMITPEEASRYGKWQLNLLTVKPGITGPWQVSGRNDLPYEERVRLSMHYIRSYTIWLDLQILLLTIPVVLGRRGAY